MPDPKLVRKTKIEVFSAVLALDAKAPVFVELAEALLEDGQAEAAVQVCQEGLAFQPNLLAGRVALVEALLAAGREEEALSALSSARHQAAQASLSLKRLSDLESRLAGQSQPAQAEAKASDSSQDDQPVDLSSPTLAYLYLRQGQPQAAVRVYKRLLQKDPANKAIRAKLKALTGPGTALDARRALNILEKWRSLVQARLA